MDPESVKRVFGDVGTAYIPVTEEFEEQLPEIIYRPASQEDLDAVRFDSPESRRDANQLVWRDQLTKAHLAASSTILRNIRWIRGMLFGHDSKNLMVFGASFRGLIEAAADSFDSLRNVPLNLAENFQTIHSCLVGEIDDRVHVSLELEEALDHYIHAQKQPRGYTGPSHLHARSARDYITTLEEANQGKIVDAYADLCEITHPASLTVTAFLNRDDQGRLRLDRNADERFIELMIREYTKIMARVLQLSLNPAFMTLRVINQLPLGELEIPQVNGLSFDQSEEWRRVKEDLGIE